MGYSPWGRKESDTTERLHFTSMIFSIKISVQTIYLLTFLLEVVEYKLQGSGTWPLSTSLAAPNSNTGTSHSEFFGVSSTFVLAP